MATKEKGPPGGNRRGHVFRKSISIDGETVPVLAFLRNAFAGAIQTSKVAVTNNSGAALVSIEQPGKSVRQAIVDIVIAYRPPGMSDEDKRRLCEIYLKMVAGYPRAVVEWTLEYLLEHNPRNTPTFTAPPTPADVKQACEKTLSTWQRWVCDFYFDPPYGKRFGMPSRNELLLNPNAKRATAEVAAKISDFETRCSIALRSPKPGEAECIVPEELQVVFLSKEIERQIARIAELDAMEQRGEIPRYGMNHLPLLEMPEDALECIPEAAFPDDTREVIKAKRGQLAEAKRLAEERARAAEEERRLKRERERAEIDREIAAIEAENAQAQEAARQELSARWGNVFFVRPNSDTAYHYQRWLRSLDRRGLVDLVVTIVSSEVQLAVPRKSPADDETELPVPVPFKTAEELRNRRRWM